MRALLAALLLLAAPVAQAQTVDPTADAPLPAKMGLDWLKVWN